MKKMYRMHMAMCCNSRQYDMALNRALTIEYINNIYIKRQRQYEKIINNNSIALRAAA